MKGKGGCPGKNLVLILIMIPISTLNGKSDDENWAVPERYDGDHATLHCISIYTSLKILYQ
jgi:hypothetical protein